MMASYIWLIFFIIFSSVIHTLFKYIALGPGGKSYLFLIFDPLFYLCGLLFVAQAISWLGVLKRLSLSKAYPYTSINLIILLICGFIFFDENISLGNFLGALVIVVGVVIITKETERA